MGLRRKSRELCVQTIYSLEFKETDEFLGKLEWVNFYKPILDDYCTFDHIEEESTVYKFSENLLLGILKNLDNVDKIINNHSVSWDIERIAILDKAVMRIATYEMMFTNTPHPIIMNEAIEVAKKFCSEKSTSFINGILNAVSKDIKKKVENKIDE